MAKRHGAGEGPKNALICKQRETQKEIERLTETQYLLCEHTLESLEHVFCPELICVCVFMCVRAHTYTCVGHRSKVMPSSTLPNFLV